MFSTRSQQAFTLIEMCIAICLIILLMGLGLPSLTGQTRMRKLQGAFDRFNAFVERAQQQSVRDGKPYVLAWTRKGTVRLVAAEQLVGVGEDTPNKRLTAVETFQPESDAEHFTLVREASLSRDPNLRWTFWPTGNCEPVRVRYEAPTGTWSASFNALSGRGTIDGMIAK